MPKFRTMYERSGSSAIDAVDCSLDPGQTKQEFKQECDINVIMSQYMKTGLAPGAASVGEYGDYAEAPDYFEAQNVVKAAEEQFSRLPSAVRDEFRNDAAAFLAFVHDEKNADRAVELGLLTPEAVARRTAPAEPPVPVPKV